MSVRFTALNIANSSAASEIGSSVITIGVFGNSALYAGSRRNGRSLLMAGFLKSLGVRWLARFGTLGIWARSASVAANTVSFSGFSAKLLVFITSAPQTLGTASTSISASRATNAHG